MTVRDYKYEMQLIAEELAQDRYSKEFYDLSETMQHELYSEAMRVWKDRQ